MPRDTDNSPPATRQPRRSKQPDGPVLPERSTDETEIGWGDEPGGRDDDWYRRERPPHHE